MKHVLLATIVIVAAAWCAVTTAAEPAAGNGKAADQIRSMEEKWPAAAIKKDTAPLEEMLADDYTLTTPQGQVIGKSGFIDRVKDGTFVIDSADYSDIKVRVYADAAVVTGRLKLKAKWADTDVSGDYAFTDTFVQHDNHWQEVAGQVTKVEAE